MSKARQLADLGNVYDDGALSSRNMVTNGAMTVAQRGTNATGIATTGYWSADRWSLGASGAGTFTISQDTDAPDGFGYSYKLDCTTADASNTAGELLYVRQMLEGQDLQGLAYGTSSAKDLTLSFWVKSNQAATFVVTLENSDASRLQSRTYSINSANTWEYKTLTFSGDTSSGFTNDNGTSLQVQFWLQSGSNFTSGTLNSTWGTTVSADYAAGLTGNIGDTVGDYFQITGVQLEVGDTATPFEHEPYSVTLQKCQRFYQKIGGPAYTGIGSGINYPTIARAISFNYLTEMRTNPSGSIIGTLIVTDRTVFDTTVSSIASFSPSTNSASIQVNKSASSGTSYYPIQLAVANGTTSYIALDAEL